MIHPTAIVEPGAEIGQDVSIGPHSYIQTGSRIGDRCTIGPNVCIYTFTTLGAGCRVHAGAVLGDTPQDVGFEGDESYVRIGDNCIIREGVTVHRGTKPGSTTEIGKDCFLMGFSHFAHNVKLGHRVLVANGALLAGYVEVGDRAFISGNVVIHQFVKIGRLVMIGGGSGISKDVPPFCIVRASSLNGIAGLNVIGLRRAGFTAEQRAEIKRAFNTLYRSEMNFSEAAAEIRRRFPTGPGLELAEFVEGSERGICPLGRTGAD